LRAIDGKAISAGKSRPGPRRGLPNSHRRSDGYFSAISGEVGGISFHFPRQALVWLPMNHPGLGRTTKPGFSTSFIGFLGDFRTWVDVAGGLRSWDGWTPHSRNKRLFMRSKYFPAHCEVPKKAPRKSGFLRTSADTPGSGIRGRWVAGFIMPPPSPSRHESLGNRFSVQVPKSQYSGTYVRYGL
jgi:hypothetical protein